MLLECLRNTIKMLQRYYCYLIIAATIAAAAVRRQARLSDEQAADLVGSNLLVENYLPGRTT